MTILKSDPGKQLSLLRETDPWYILRKHYRPILKGLLILLVSRVCAMTIPVSTKYLLDNVILAGNLNKLPLLAVVSAILVAIQIMTSVTANTFFATLGENGVMELRTLLWMHICHLPLEFHDKGKVGAILSRIMNDLDGVRWLIGPGFADVAGASASNIIVIILMAKIGFSLTAVALGFLAVFCLMLWFNLKKSKSMHLDYNALRAQIMGRLAESLAGVRVTKAYCAEQTEVTTLRARFVRLSASAVKITNVHSWMGGQAIAIFGIANIVFFWMGAHQISTKAISIGSFVLFMTVANTLGGSTFQLVASTKQINEAVAALQRMREILEIEREDNNPLRTVAVPEIRGELCFDNVSFEYQTGQKVLDRMSFTTAPGTVTAIVGSSGSGKTTVTNLAAGFYRPTAGKIYIDGVDLETIVLGSYRKNLGLVLQDSFLFDGTIQENIAFSRPSTTLEEVKRASRIAYVDEFVDQFEDGYNSLIGERGVRLSAGQRQRVAVARAVLAQPRILILDEATSNLDSESEAVIQQALAVVMKGITAIVVAHRLSTIRQADQILVMEKGRIIERGTHESLFAARGRYFELYKRQSLQVEEISEENQVV